MIQKYEELYQLSKESLAEELQRSHRIEEKASRFFAVLSLLLALSGISGKFILTSVIPPKNWIDFICMSFAILFVLSALSGLYFTFKVFQLSYLVKAPVDNDVIKFFDDNEYLDIIYALARGNTQALQENRTIIDKKVNNLSKAYRRIVIAILFILLFCLAIATKYWISAKCLTLTN